MQAFVLFLTSVKLLLHALTTLYAFKAQGIVCVIILVTVLSLSKSTSFKFRFGLNSSFLAANVVFIPLSIF